MHLREIPELLYLRYKVKLYLWLEELKVKKRYYHDARYKESDQILQASINPYKVAAAYPYGETPLTTLDTLIERFELTAEDTFLDLGCGRGRSVLFSSWKTGCRSIGVERSQELIKTAALLTAPKASFVCADFFECDLNQATFIYLYGTCLTAVEVERLCNRFSKLKKGVKIVTISYPLERFNQIDQITASFPWGQAEVFLCQTTGN